MASASVLESRFLPHLSSGYPAFDNELLYETLNEINYFLNELLVVMIFHHSNNNPKIVHKKKIGEALVIFSRGSSLM